jgi:PAS domain S-box-containing protein
LLALASYQIDPVHGLPSLNPIVDMAVKLFDCPMAAVNLVGDTRVFLAANVGIGDCDLTRDASFCAHAINQDGIMVVEDAALDPRFHDNPIVLSGMVRFYAGVALRAPSGHALGALCVIDPQPRTGFTTQDRTRLMQLAAMVADRLELRRMEVASASMRPGGFAATAIGSPSAILSCDDRACLTDCNAAAAQMFGWGERELIGTSLEDLIADADRARVHDGIRRVLQGDVPITEGTLLTALRRDGTRFDAELHWSRWHEGARVYFGVIIRDLSATQSEQDALYQLANFDPVTQLPNRNLLLRHLDEAFGNGHGIALVLVDLDGFHDINTTLGRGWATVCCAMWPTASVAPCPRRG